MLMVIAHEHALIGIRMRKQGRAVHERAILCDVIDAGKT